MPLATYIFKVLPHTFQICLIVYDNVALMVNLACLAVEVNTQMGKSWVTDDNNLQVVLKLSGTKAL